MARGFPLAMWVCRYRGEGCGGYRHTSRSSGSQAWGFHEHHCQNSMRCHRNWLSIPGMLPGSGCNEVLSHPSPAQIKISPTRLALCNKGLCREGCQSYMWYAPRGMHQTPRSGSKVPYIIESCSYKFHCVSGQDNIIHPCLLAFTN